MHFVVLFAATGMLFFVYWLIQFLIRKVTLWYKLKDQRTVKHLPKETYSSIQSKQQQSKILQKNSQQYQLSEQILQKKQNKKQQLQENKRQIYQISETNKYQAKAQVQVYQQAQTKHKNINDNDEKIATKKEQKQAIQKQQQNFQALNQKHPNNLSTIIQNQSQQLKQQSNLISINDSNKDITIKKLIEQLNQSEQEKQQMKISIVRLQQQLSIKAESSQYYKERVAQLQNNLMKGLQSMSNGYQEINEEIEIMKLKEQQQIFKNINSNSEVSMVTGSYEQLQEQNLSYRKQIEELLTDNQNLKNQLDFCQHQLEQFYESEKNLKEELERINSILSINSHNGQILANQDLVNKMHQISPIPKNKEHISRQKSLKAIKKYDNSNYYSHIDYPSQKQPHKKSRVSVRSVRNQQGYFHKQNNFLPQCKYLTIQHLEFLYSTLQKIFTGSLCTKKLYSSSSPIKNIHSIIDNISSILLIIQLKNKKIIGAYTQQPFDPQQPHSSAHNISLMLDITNCRYFACQSGQHSINYSSDALIWGYNQLMLKNQQRDVIYTNFCRKHNLYWDGKYTIEEFIGDNKHWARIQGYQIHQVVKP